jgi:hypothetical protein
MTSTIGDTETLHQLSNFLTNTPILTQLAQPTSSHTRVKNDKNWHTLTTLFYPIRTYTHIPPFPNYTFALPIKFPLIYSYHTYGSFTPPKQTAPNTWRPETASFPIHTNGLVTQILTKSPLMDFGQTPKYQKTK